MRAIVITGPTGVGKTELAIILSKLVNGEIISFDSVQIYKKLDIGSNKATKEEQAACTHHLIDYVDFNKPYSAADFYEDCQRTMQMLALQHKTPLLVGGNGFYIDWLLRGRPKAPPSDDAIEREIYKEIANEDWDASWSRLQKIDPEYAAKLNKGDYYRLVRALAVNRMTGNQMENYKADDNFQSIANSQFDCFYLTDDRLDLYRKVDLRCEKMIQNGLLDEIISLMKEGFNLDQSAAGNVELPMGASTTMASKSIGYSHGITFIKQLNNLINSDLNPSFTLDKKIVTRESIELFKNFLFDFQAASRQYVRRQETWFYKKKEFCWISRSNKSLEKIAQLIAQKYLMKSLDEAEDSLKSELMEIDKEARYEKESKKLVKLMRTYRPTLHIFHSNESISDLLESVIIELLKKEIHIN